MDYRFQKLKAVVPSLVHPNEQLGSPGKKSNPKNRMECISDQFRDQL
jgi:hypothetical protein